MRARGKLARDVCRAVGVFLACVVTIRFTIASNDATTRCLYSLRSHVYSCVNSIDGLRVRPSPSATLASVDDLSGIRGAERGAAMRPALLFEHGTQ